METQAPSAERVAIAVGFAISCFALLLFLWVSFGGPVPLGAKSYRVHASFDEATQLAVESDIRISGVSVGRVKSIELGDDGRADTELEIEPRYAPLPVNTRAILRQKTLLGETYVELTSGEVARGMIPEDGSIKPGRIAPAVQLDEIFRTFDPDTREAFRIWMEDGSKALAGRGDDLNDAIGALGPFTSEGREILATLDRQDRAVRGLIRDGGRFFAALSERRGQLRGLIENTDTAFSTIAARDGELRDTFRIFPVFLDESRLTLRRLQDFSTDADPLIGQLRPAARRLSGTLEVTKRLIPSLRGFLEDFPRLARRAPSGLGALREVLDDRAPPLLSRADPYLAEVNQLLRVAKGGRREVTAFLGNVAAATNGFNVPAGSTSTVQYLRTLNVFGPSVLAGYPGRLAANRTNPYVAPGGYGSPASGLESFETRHCSAGLTATLDPSDAAAFPGDLFDRLRTYAFAGKLSSDDIPAPECRRQSPLRSFGGPPGERTAYRHVRADP